MRLAVARPIRAAATTVGTPTTGYVQALPPHAVRLEDGDWRFTLLPLLHGRIEGSGGSATEAAAAIRVAAPRQVLVELCASRYAKALMSAVEGVPAPPPPRLDLLGNVHGGLLGHEFAPILEAARDVGAAIVPVDRSQATLRSRIGQGLWHPRLLQGLIHYGHHSLVRQDVAKLSDAESLRQELENLCPAAHKVLVEERSICLAQQIRTAAVQKDEVFVVCGAPHFANVVEALKKPPREGGADELSRLARRYVPVWPLYGFGYVVVPVAFAAYAVKNLWETVLLPAFDFEVAGEDNPPPPHALRSVASGG